MKDTAYEAPSMELLDIKIEQGYVLSAEPSGDRMENYEGVWD